jgi:hypothetical protein
MKISKLLYAVALLFVSCRSHETKNDQQITTADSSTEKTETPRFFPVTDYLKGQVYEIKNGGLNPIKIITEHSHTDSGWLKMEDLYSEVTDFFTPEIDSANLISLFSEKKFLDQTLNSITFTYDPVKILPDSFALQHWDVYVDPNSGKVTRIYLVKKLPQKKIQQLTWLTGKSCNIKTIVEDTTGRPVIEKEMTIKWDPKG